MKARCHYKLRLYVAGGTQNSALALTNLRILCRVHLPDRCEIEIVDILQEPRRALRDSIFMTPALVRMAPVPRLSIVGTLSHPQTVLDALDLQVTAA